MDDIQGKARYLNAIENLILPMKEFKPTSDIPSYQELLGSLTTDDFNDVLDTEGHHAAAIELSKLPPDEFRAVQLELVEMQIGSRDN